METIYRGVNDRIYRRFRDEKFRQFICTSNTNGVSRLLSGNWAVEKLFLRFFSNFKRNEFAWNRISANRRTALRRINNETGTEPKTTTSVRRLVIT